MCRQAGHVFKRGKNHQWTRHVSAKIDTMTSRACVWANHRDKQHGTDLTMGPSCRMCSSTTSGLSLPRSRWMKVRVSCTSTDGTSVKRSVSPCQIWSPAERYVELRYSAAVVSAVNRDTDTKMELGSRILTHSAIWGTRRAASLGVRTSITFPPERPVSEHAGEDGVCVGPHRRRRAAARLLRRGSRRAGCFHSQVLYRRETAGGAREKKTPCSQSIKSCNIVTDISSIHMCLNQKENLPHI